MMTKQHRQKMKAEKTEHITISKSSLKRNLTIGVIAVLLSATVILTRGQLVGALHDHTMVTQPEAQLVEAAATEKAQAMEANVPQTKELENADAMAQEDTAVDYSALPWNLILVNREHLLPRNFTVDLGQVGDYLVDGRIVQPLSQMMQDAKAAGVDLQICSAYRSISKQTALFDAEVQDNQKMGYDSAKSEEIAELYTQTPGASEHHTGLALDIITPSYQTLDSGFANTLAFQWLHIHAAEYGFVIRYPEGKQDVTGILYEPWHFRYVGVKEATEMTTQGECLEEYVMRYENTTESTPKTSDVDDSEQKVQS